MHKFQCLTCNRSRAVNGLLPHLESKLHRKKTLAEDLERLVEAQTILRSKRNKSGDQKKAAHRKKEKTKAYLEFTGFLLTLKLSYAQIEKIGYKLKDLACSKRLDFVKYHSFSQENIPQTCLRMLSAAYSSEDS